jgi:hypothetical protein
MEKEIILTVFEDDDQERFIIRIRGDDIDIRREYGPTCDADRTVSCDIDGGHCEICDKSDQDCAANTKTVVLRVESADA